MPLHTVDGTVAVQIGSIQYTVSLSSYSEYITITRYSTGSTGVPHTSLYYSNTTTCYASTSMPVAYAWNQRVVKSRKCSESLTRLITPETRILFFPQLLTMVLRTPVLAYTVSSLLCRCHLSQHRNKQWLQCKSVDSNST